MLGFNPRTYKRCDLLPPTPLFCLSRVSIHAPTRGATFQLRQRLQTSFGFNPRTYKRCDFCFLLASYNGIVSIHAPTRGATPYLAKIYQDKTSFNPRTYKRCDSIFGWLCIGLCRFNPRTYKRCDIPHIQNLIPTLLFQSTHLQEVRQKNQFSDIVPEKVSIHAPTRGATLYLGILLTSSLPFQSTHLQEVRHYLCV